MKCTKCPQDLLMSNITSHYTSGLAYISTINCENCNLINEVETSRKHRVNNNTQNFLHAKVHNDMTTKAVLVACHSDGIRTELNKILACLDLATINPSVYREYELGVGPALENQAMLICDRAAEEECRLLLEKMEELEKL
ncbi:hypothetical protein QAD02_012537 [Eretmocerus hayati]|uniref:Uncharacterized protein n=1 Tax=Eretmocerus hayati TaxID=131215 RepID=A0ACC2NZP5_9HYME|nr:hypothetical protein QAD02_012537 [Eretmocerus hayati]